MAKKNYNKQLRYKFPLPIEPHPFPSLAQPVKLITWIVDWLLQWSDTRIIDLEINALGQLLVMDQWQMKYLWEHGFFGTGQLSRSEPNWLERTRGRLQLDEGNKINLEQVTDVRRRQRLEFKRMRADFEAKKLEMRRNGIIDEQFLEQERLFLKELREKELQFDEDAHRTEVRQEDEDILENGHIVQLESLQLMPVEAIFLSYAVPVIRLPINELMRSLLPEPQALQDIKRLLQKYIAYHHYRSKGWCVRSGIKFGCEFLLYRRGPPFQHAEYGIMVLDAEESRDYTWYSSAARVIGGAKKQFVLCYVESLASDEYILQLWQECRYGEVFKQYRVHELLYKRWVAGKNRD